MTKASLPPGPKASKVIFCPLPSDKLFALANTLSIAALVSPPSFPLWMAMANFGFTLGSADCGGLSAAWMFYSQRQRTQVAQTSGAPRMCSALHTLVGHRVDRSRAATPPLTRVNRCHTLDLAMSAAPFRCLIFDHRLCPERQLPEVHNVRWRIRLEGSCCLAGFLNMSGPRRDGPAKAEAA